MSPNSATVNRRTVRAILAAGLACLISGIAVLLAALLPAASAQPSFEDFPGNATDCNEGNNPAGLEGEILLQGTGSAENALLEGTVSGDDNQFLNIVVLDPDVVITGTVVKAGPGGYRVYYGDPVEDMTAPPLDPAKPDKFPAISHWFVCGFVEEPTSPPPTEPTSPPPTTPGEAPTTPAGELPKTGSANGWLAALGAGLLLGGAGLVLAGRQASRHQA